MPLTRSQLLAGAAAVAVPLRTRTPAPLAALAAAMRGPVLLPGSAAYARLRPGFNGRYAGVRPAAIAQPLDARDLAAALKVARARGLAVRVRAGGHSYIGASTVEETAVAVLAEIIAHRAGREGGPLREASGPIRRRRAETIRPHVRDERR